MKAKQFLRFAMVLFAILAINHPAWADTSTLTFTAACGGSGTADDDAEWTVTSDGVESTFDSTHGIHYGTSSKSVQYVQLSTSDIDGTITEVVVRCRDAQACATVSVTVGGTAFTCSGSATATNSSADYTFTGSGSGEIVVKVDRGSSKTKAIYVKSVVVTYSATSSYTITATRNNDSYGTISVSGSTITATPENGYKVMSGASGYTVVSGTATVTNNGDNTFTVSASSDCTIRINFESKGCIDKGASSITSGTSSSSDYGPLHAYYDYSTSQILYTKSDLDLATGKKGTIKSIYFEYAGAAAMDARTIVIYMANTSLTSLSTSNYVPYASFTQVYSGTFSCSSTGWYEITLDTPFEYNGSGNLAVMIDDNTNSYQSNKTFKYHSATGTQIYTRQDDTDINPSSWTPASAIDYRPNTKFCIQESDMTPATVTLMDNSATLTEASAGAGVTLPSRTGCTGYTFAGWTKSWTEEQDEWTTTSPTIIPVGSYTPSANENLYPVYTKTESGGGTTTETYGFEDADVATNWTIDGPSANTSQHKTGSKAGKITTNNTYVTFKNKVKVTNFSFQFMRTSTNNNYNVYIETSTNNSTWTAVETYAMNTFTQNSWTAKSHTFDGETELYVRFHCYNTTAERWVDDVSITYSGGSTTSYISVPNCCTSLGAINGSIILINVLWV